MLTSSLHTLTKTLEKVRSTSTIFSGGFLSRKTHNSAHGFIKYSDITMVTSPVGLSESLLQTSFSEATNRRNQLKFKLNFEELTSENSGLRVGLTELSFLFASQYINKHKPDLKKKTDVNF